MIRDELRQLRRSFNSVSRAERGVYGIIVLMILLTVGGLINLPPIDAGFKIALFSVAIAGLIFISFCIYRHQLDPSTESEPEPEHDTRERAKLNIPERPRNPPTISVEKPANSESSKEGELEVVDEDIVTEYHDENPALYRHHFSIVPVVFRIILVAALWLALLILSMIHMRQELWVFFAASTVISPLYCYYIVLRWNGEEFVVNEEWYARPLTMPSPFNTTMPAIRRNEIGKYEFKQTFVDKIFKTCELFSDTPSAHDKKFHKVKWLTHPAELRRATGISAPRKNSWLSPFRGSKG